MSPSLIHSINNPGIDWRSTCLAIPKSDVKPSWPSFFHRTTKAWKRLPNKKAFQLPLFTSGAKPRAESRCLPDAHDQGADRWSSRDKFAAVIETAAMNAEELVVYCCQRSLYPEHLQRWCQDCEQPVSHTRNGNERLTNPSNSASVFKCLNVN